MKFGDISSPESKEEIIDKFKILLETGGLKCEIKNINNNGETKWKQLI